MKVLVLSNMYPTDSHPTYGIFVRNQVEMLRSNGVNVEVSAIADPGKGRAAALKKYGAWALNSVQKLFSGRKSYTVTHAHYAFPTGLLSLLGKRLFGVPYVVTVHGGDLDQMAKKSPQIRRMTRSILNEAAHVITVGQRLYKDVTGEYGIPASSVSVLSMGVDTNVFRIRERSIIRKELGIAEGEKAILFVGNIIRAKGTMELAEAASILAREGEDVTVYLVGSLKDSAYAEELRAKVRELGLENIRFVGTEPQERLSKWMNACDVLALPSYHEGFGLVALEGMASGIRVVGSDVGGLSVLLSDGRGILVKPRDAESLATGIRSVLEDDRNLLDEEAIQAEVALHSKEQILIKLIKIYEEAAGR